ncbi:hypothetical protein BX666DRAFT_2030763 [Dichotomocladium elegans]|nr:hypothetical protein BX666DRAFT_2030763 [Dichotomocladium elegans]
MSTVEAERLIVEGLLERLTNASDPVPITTEVAESSRQNDLLESRYFILCLLLTCLEWWYSEQHKEKNNAEKEYMLQDDVVIEIIATVMPYFKQPPKFAAAFNRPSMDKTIRMVRNKRSTVALEWFYEVYACPFYSQHCHAGEHILCTRSYIISSKIIHRLSQVVWPFLFSRIQTALMLLTNKTASSGNIGTLEERDILGEVLLLGSCKLDAKRLSKVIQVFNEVLPAIHENLQVSVSVVAYHAIWEWIDAYSDEFVDLSIIKKREIMWPFLTSLILLCPDMLAVSLQTTDLSNTSDRRDTTNSSESSCYFAFTDFLMTMQNLKSRWVHGRVDFSMISALDVCRAAAYLHKRTETRIIHQIILKVKPDLRDQLFNLDGGLLPDFTTVSINDQGSTVLIDRYGLMIECFSTLYHLNPHYITHDLFPLCLSDESPVYYKVTLLRGIHESSKYIEELGVFREEDRQWTPGSAYFYSIVCKPLRALFLNCMAAVDIDVSVGSGADIPTTDIHPSIVAASSSSSSSSDTKGAIDSAAGTATTGDDQDGTTHSRSLLAAVTQCLRLPSADVVHQATECLRKLHTIEYVPYWGSGGPSTMMENYWSVSSYGTLTFAKIMLDIPLEQADTMNTLLSVLQIIMKERITFLTSMDQEQVLEGWNPSDYLQATIGLEVALLVLLCSSDQDVLDRTFECFGLLCVEIKHLFCSNDDGDNDKVKQGDRRRTSAARLLIENYPIYKALSELPANNALASRKVYQRRIWSLLRMMPHDAPGHLVAWKEVYKRWKLMHLVIRSPWEGVPAMFPLNSVQGLSGTMNTADTGIGTGGGHGSGSMSANGNGGGIGAHLPVHSLKLIDHPYQNVTTSQGWSQQFSKYTEWNNFACFLASLSGACSSQRQEVGSPLSSPSQSTNQAEGFIKDMISLLSSHDIFIRERSKDVLSTELARGMRPVFLKQLCQAVSRGMTPTSSAQYVLLIEQTIVILTTITENLSNEPEVVDTDMFLTFYEIIDHCATFLLCMTGSSSITENTVRLRLQFARLCEVIMQKNSYRSINTLHGKYKVRTKLLEIIIEWTTSFGTYLKNGLEASRKEGGVAERSRTRPSYSVNNPQQRDGNINYELEHTCIRAMTLLLYGLPLQPAYFDVTQNFAQLADQGPDYLRLQVFTRYYGYFVHLLLHVAVSVEDPETILASVTNRNEPAIPATASLGYLFTPHTVKRCIEKPIQTKEFAYLIQNQVVHGLANLIAANIDLGLRVSLPLLYNPITVVRVGMLEALANAFYQKPNFKIVTDETNKFSIAILLCTSCPASKIDAVANGTLCCLGARRKITPFLRVIIAKEVDETENDSQLFRRTTVTTHILSSMAKRFGAEYIKEILMPVFRLLATKCLPEGTSYEVNPDRANPDENIEENRNNVMALTDMLLTAICDSASKAPPQVS